MDRIADLAAGARYEDWELEYPDIQNVVEMYRDAYSNLLDDIIDKGIDKINLNEYEGLDVNAAA
mgnify:CR=1 FL=1